MAIKTDKSRTYYPKDSSVYLEAKKYLYFNEALTKNSWFGEASSEVVFDYYTVTVLQEESKQLVSSV